VGSYDKLRPTSTELEQSIMPGEAASVFECDFGTVGGAICFDLNFDELRLQYATLRPDLILFASMYHGGLMQSYWAYSCRSHLVSAISNPNAPSQVVLPTGSILAQSTNYTQFVTASINLDCALVHLDCFFSKIDEVKREYGPKLQIFDPGLLGSVLLSAEAEDLSITEVIDQFELELLDPYLDRSRVACASVAVGHA
jgi:predicted amidohydrolase